jgi:hypothetical protein
VPPAIATLIPRGSAQSDHGAIADRGALEVPFGAHAVELLGFTVVTRSQTPVLAVRHYGDLNDSERETMPAAFLSDERRIMVATKPSAWASTSPTYGSSSPTHSRATTRKNESACAT